jgi:hypothetical protein
MQTLIIKDLSHPARELEQKELARIAGGMIDTGNRPPPQQDDGSTWVPVGQTTYWLAGVRQPGPFGS